jgi:segregation and condensation protein B
MNKPMTPNSSLRPPAAAQALHALAYDCEALLFVSRGPISLARLAAFTNASENSVRKALRSLSRTFAQRGIELCSTPQGYFFSHAPRTNAAVAAYHQESCVLSEEAMETLAVIAYLQPIDEACIVNVRLRDTTHTLETLLTAGLIERTLEEDGIERYVTTTCFLESAGIASLDALPFLLEADETECTP